MKIAIVKLSALGDIVHAMIVLQAIKKIDSTIQIDWIVEEVFAPVLAHNPDINHIYTLNLKSLKKNKLQIFAELKKAKRYAQNNYDLVIDLQGLIKSAIIAKILGNNVGFDRKSIRESAAARLYKKSYYVPYEKNVIERNLKLVELVFDTTFHDIFICEKSPLLYFLEKDRIKIKDYLKKDKKNIIYILGSSWKSKIYPKEKFVTLIEALEGNHLLVWGNDNELILAKYVEENTTVSVLPRLNLNELKALVSEADLVIGGDSGPTHFAWALNRPSITIFGPTSSQRNTYVTQINRVIDCGEEINPLKLDKQNFCIEYIEVSKIIDIAKELLA